MMMASFNVTRLETLGYDNVESLDNPDDPRFTAQDWSADAYSDDQIQSRLNYLGNLGAYNERDQIVSAVAAYYTNTANAPVETLEVGAAREEADHRRDDQQPCLTSKTYGLSFTLLLSGVFISVRVAKHPYVDDFGSDDAVYRLWLQLK
jgi:hypothetical protein